MIKQVVVEIAVASVERQGSWCTTTDALAARGAGAAQGPLPGAHLDVCAHDAACHHGLSCVCEQALQNMPPP